MEKVKPSYYSILTANVRYDKDLKPNAKLLYSEISALSNINGYCNASNAYFANLYQVNERTIRAWIKQLSEKDYIDIKTEYKIGTNQIIKRKLYIKISPGISIDPELGSNDPPPGSNDPPPPDQKIQNPPDQKILYNNTRKENNTSMNSSKKLTHLSFEIFKEEIKTKYPKYLKFDLKYYYDRACIHLDTHNKTVPNFTAYAVSFMIGDQSNKKEKLKTSSEVTANTYNKDKPLQQRKTEFWLYLQSNFSSYKISDLKQFYGVFSKNDNNDIMLIEKSTHSVKQVLNAFLHSQKKAA